MSMGCNHVNLGAMPSRKKHRARTGTLIVEISPSMNFICLILHRSGKHAKPRPAVPASSNVIISSATSGPADTMDIEIVGVSKRRRYNCGVAPQTKQDLP